MSGSGGTSRLGLYEATTTEADVYKAVEAIIGGTERLDGEVVDLTELFERLAAAQKKAGRKGLSAEEIAWFREAFAGRSERIADDARSLRELVDDLLSMDLDLLASGENYDFVHGLMQKRDRAGKSLECLRKHIAQLEAAIAMGAPLSINGKIVDPAMLQRALDELKAVLPKLEEFVAWFDNWRKTVLPLLLDFLKHAYRRLMA